MPGAMACGGMKFGIGITWTTGLNRNTGGSNFPGNSFGERDEVGFGGGVFSHIWNRKKPGGRSHINDGSFALAHHRGKEKPGTFGHMVHVQVYHVCYL